MKTLYIILAVLLVAALAYAGYRYYQLKSDPANASKITSADKENRQITIVKTQ